MRIPIVMFRVGDVGFSLNLKDVKLFLPPRILKDCPELPGVFSGYISYKNEMIPALDISYLTHEASMQDIARDPSDQNKHIILLKTNEGRNACLALVVDHIEAKFLASKRHFSPIEKNVTQTSWIKDIMTFGEQSYLNIHPQKLIQCVENFCLMSINFENIPQYKDNHYGH